MKKVKMAALVCLAILFLMLIGCGRTSTKDKKSITDYAKMTSENPINSAQDNNQDNKTEDEMPQDDKASDDVPDDIQGEKVESGIDSNEKSDDKTGPNSVQEKETEQNKEPDQEKEPAQNTNSNPSQKDDPVKYFDTDDNWKHGESADLNGDGKKDKIQIFCPYDPNGGYYDYTLKINDSKGNFSGDTIEPQFNIVDIKKGDGFKEVAVSEYGPSDDYRTTFYHYDGKSITSMGSIEGFYGSMPLWNTTGNMVVDGSGTVKTRSRGQILQTWFYDDEYVLNKNLTFKKISKDLYEMNTEVTVLTDITLRKSRTDKSDGITLKAGETVIIKESDNKKWCSVVNKNGEVGWFEVYNFSTIKGLELPAYEIFEGLCYAD